MFVRSLARGGGGIRVRAHGLWMSGGLAGDLKVFDGDGDVPGTLFRARSAMPIAGGEGEPHVAPLTSGATERQKLNYLTSLRITNPRDSPLKTARGASPFFFHRIARNSSPPVSPCLHPRFPPGLILHLFFSLLSLSHLHLTPVLLYLPHFRSPPPKVCTSAPRCMVVTSIDIAFPAA